jgi:FkbM family methyltransferase
MHLSEFIYTVLLKPKPLRACANAVLKAIIPEKKNLHGGWWVLNQNDPVVSGAATLSVYENAETAFFERVCRPGMTLLDIGANSGYYTALASGLMQGKGKIISFEPDPESHEYLNRTAKANPGMDITVLQAAASDMEVTRKLYRNPENRGDNRLYPNELCANAVEVRCVPVDKLVAELGVTHVDLIKIDVQGFEGHVLRGMQRILSSSPRITLLMEFWPSGLKQAGSDAATLLRDLEALSFTLFELQAGGSLLPLEAHEDFIARLPGRTYTSLVGIRRDAPMLPGRPQDRVLELQGV